MKTTKWVKIVNDKDGQARLESSGDMSAEQVLNLLIGGAVFVAGQFVEPDKVGPMLRAYLNQTLAINPKEED